MPIAIDKDYRKMTRVFDYFSVGWLK